MRRLLDDADFVVRQPVEFVDELVDLPVGRVDSRDALRPRRPQVAANRENARKSTGPRTLQGKRRSRRNALKHSLLARECVVTEGDGRENIRQFDRLLADLIHELNPQGLIEQTLVERIATIYWRLRRAQRYEVGAIRESLDESNIPLDDPDVETADDVRRQLEKEQARLHRARSLLDDLDTLPDLSDPVRFAAYRPALDRLPARLKKP